MGTLTTCVPSQDIHGQRAKVLSLFTCWCKFVILFLSLFCFIENRHPSSLSSSCEVVTSSTNDKHKESGPFFCCSSLQGFIAGCFGQPTNLTPETSALQKGTHIYSNIAFSEVLWEVIPLLKGKYC